MSRIYKVTLKTGKTHAVLLVKASTKSGAIRQASIGTISAEVASQDELVKLITEGVKVEESRESLPTEAEQPSAHPAAKTAKEGLPEGSGLKGAFAAQ